MAMADQRTEHPHRHHQPPHEAVLLSKIITEKKQIRVTFLDGDTLIDGLRWHTPYHLGMKDGKVINKSAIKFWEIVE
jgi:hypothetical protein